ncbi:MAG: AraC family transcriptional regulator [Prevotella sp.]|nr:AraC family transcriptional regulator [Prevotella sp.]MBQ9204819.1 AraC family transcriptional regulator [Prevotella sp.]
MARHWGNAEYLVEGLVLTDRIADAPIPTVPTRLNFILMALCRKGKAQYSIDTREQQVLPGDLLFISERHIVDNYMASPDFECLCIMVSTEFYHGFVQNVKNVSSLLLFSKNNPVVSLTPREVQTYANYYQTIREKIGNTSHHYRTELVKALLLAMFYDMSDVIYRVNQSSNKKQSRADILFMQFIHLLEEHFRSERRVSWYAEQLFITPKYLAEIVKQVSKRTPNEWIDSYVVLEARVLLKNSTKNIKEIAKELHFPNQSFLGKYFKEHVGVSPSEYRKK